jgi:hypothetical protein
MKTTIAYDTTLKRPGCVVVQRGLGATISNEDLHRMEGWLTAPTPDMKVYEVTSEQIEKLVEITK